MSPKTVSSYIYTHVHPYIRRSQWSRGLRHRSAAARLLRSWVWIPPGAWMFVFCECCVLSGRGLCDELITRPEESYRLWCVVVCDLENLKNEEAITRVGLQLHRKKTYIHTYIIHTYAHTYVHTYIHTYVHRYVHTYVRTNIHTYIHNAFHRSIISSRSKCVAEWVIQNTKIWTVNTV